MKTNSNTALTPSIPDGASVKIIGLGGTGGIVARFGAMFLASLGRKIRLLLIDGDAFEPSNATRMFFSSHGNKAAVVRAELLPRFAQSSLTLMAIEEYVTAENVARLIRTGDIIILCVNNHATRKLVSNHCSTLADSCLISAGNDGVGTDSAGRPVRGTFGNCQIYIRRASADVTPPLTKLHGEIANPADRLPTDKSCTELMASTPQILFANLTAAAACLNTLWLRLCGRRRYAEICFDIAEGQMSPVA